MEFPNPCEMSPCGADTEYLSSLVQSTNAGLEQLHGLGMQWKATQNHATQLILEELKSLKLHRSEAERKHQSVLNEDVFCQMKLNSKHAVLDEGAEASSRSQCSAPLTLDDSQSSAEYWKRKANVLDSLLKESLHREDVLRQKIREYQCQSPIGELQRQLTRVSNFLHFTLRNAPVAISHLDKDLRYRFLYNSFPGTYADIIGKRVEDIYNGPNLKENIEFKLQVLKRGLPAIKEISYNVPGVGKKSFLLYLRPVHKKTGDPLGLNIIYVDISEEVENREKLLKVREALAVQKAMETEMRKTMGITEQTIKAKQLLATMSHEIRSPLSGVVSMAELLAGTNLDPEQQHLVDVMVASGDLVLQLLNDIIDLANAESGGMKLEETCFYPREIVKNVIQIAAASLQKNLQLEACVSAEVPTEVVGDVLRLRQILTNLVSNAVKFTHKGSVQVLLQRIREHDTDEHLAWLEFKVVDTGIGIPESALPLLFTKYMQASETHQRKYGGTGLGLAISKQLVELMGGRLLVESKEQHGSTFSFKAPFKKTNGSVPCEDNGPFRFFPMMPKLKKRPQPSVLEARCEQSSSSESRRPRKQVKILLAEDNKVNILVAQKMLRHFGLEAKVVNNGVDAVQAARDDHYDLILMDVFMPQMDGLEATRLIREYQKERSRRSSIVAMTANTFGETECYSHGMDSFVTKPLSFDKLRGVLEQFFPLDQSRPLEMND